MDTPIAVITPSPIRRVISVGLLLILGGLLIYLAISNPPASILLQIFLLGLGVGAIVFGDKLRRATAHSIILTEAMLADSSGRDICQLEDIVGIDRGVFAFKPANGFLLRVNAQAARSWSPGLWWRFGGRIGVGGVIPRSQGKQMAEMIAMHLSERDVG